MTAARGRAPMHPLIPTIFLTLVALVVSIVLWWSGPIAGDKFTDLGVSLFVSAIVGIGIIFIERSLAQHSSRAEAIAAEEARFLKSLFETSDLTGIRLRGRTLSSVMLTGRDLGPADLRDTILDRADLRQTNIVGGTVAGASATDANLSLADLRLINAEQFISSESSFVSAKLSESTLTSAQFIKCPMAGASLYRAKLDKTSFTDCDMKHVDFGNAEGTDTSFASSDLRAATFVGTHLLSPDFRKADLRGADLSSAVWDEPDLRGSDLRDCNMTATTIRKPRSDDNTRWPSSYRPATTGAH